MHIPESFTDRLRATFGDKYRIRWSDARGEWHLEQRVRRGIAEGCVNVAPRNRAARRASEDDLIRGRDGYVLTMTITAGTHTDCDTCGTRIDVPAFTTTTVKCGMCATKGRNVGKVAGYYPLGDTLIDHLQFIDAGSGGTDRVFAAVKRHNDLVEHDNTMQLRRNVDAATRERFNRITGIHQNGYTGREAMWER
jgi:hypothetical protein